MTFLALLLPPSPLAFRSCAGRLRCGLLRLRSHSEQPRHDAPLFVRYPHEGVTDVLLTHGGTVAQTQFLKPDARSR